MFFERIEVEGLAHYSYALGCPASHQLAIVDPERNLDRYLDLAHERGMHISHVLETHIHADYASGARDLAERAGAELCLSAHDRGELFEIAYRHRALRTGDRIELGGVAMVARHTPGHTPEHLAFVVYDQARSRDVPILMLSGDFLFVGSVGRPDLLGEEQAAVLAERMYESVQALSDLPDGLEIHPAHGAGSMCGSGMSGRPSSTLGYERAANPYLDPTLSREAFRARLLGDVPPRPPYYARMKALNACGPARLSSLPGLVGLDINMFHERRERGALVIDVRDPRAYAAGHVPDSFSIGTGRSFTNWAAWLLPPGTPLLLVAPDGESARLAARALLRVGLDDTLGHLEGGVEAWRHAGLPLRTTPQVTPGELVNRLRSAGLAGVIDVRDRGEWDSGHIAGATHLRGEFLAEHLAEVPCGGPVAVVCATGYRSTVAASLLERAGFADVLNVAGGMTAWRSAGLPVKVAGEASADQG